MKRKKFYILITLLITVIIFSTAAICNQCAITPTTEITTATETSVTAAGESNITETLSNTTQAQETTEGATASEGGTATKPAVNIDRIYGPVKEGDLCVQRFKANVTGSPKPTIKWNRDDSNAAFGKDVAQVNLKAGEEFDLSVTAANSAGSSTAAKHVKYECGQSGQQGTTAQGLSADITPTDIYPANEPNGVIFARITNNGPDTLKGSKITITVSGSKTDISGASTQNFITQPKEYFLNLKPGEAQIINLEVGIDTSKYSYNFSITVAPADFTDPNTANNSYSEAFSAIQTQPKSATIPLVPGESGYMENGGSTFNDSSIWGIYFGDSVTNKPCRGFMSFNIKPFIGIKIVSCSTTTAATDTIIYGDPVTLGYPETYHVDWGARPITQSDFDISGKPTNTMDIVKAELQQALDSGKDRFQIRMQFSAFTDNDFIADGIEIKQGNIILSITYNQ